MFAALLLLATPLPTFCSGLASATPAPAPAGARSAVGAPRREPGANKVEPAIGDGLPEEEASVVSWLASDEMGQGHLFDGWASATVEDRRRLIRQIVDMDDAYPEDAEGRAGLTAYVAHARELLADSAAGKNPFEGYTVELPEGEVMSVGSDAFREDERLGLAHIQNAAFVLVAGGLGERLGYDGIKVELSAETLTGGSFLQTYITALLAMQRNGADPSRPVPLIIMTSADTHAKTVALLEANDYYGMPPEQIHFITQSNVPAISDNDGRFAQKGDPFSLQTKPHGHGDVHTLLHTSGLLPRLAAEGRTHLVFFQDTNVLAFKAIPSALGVSVRRDLAMNSLTVPRAPARRRARSASSSSPTARRSSSTSSTTSSSRC